jgi:hypothetical protein
MTARAKITLLTFFFAACATAAVLTAYWQNLQDENVKPAELYAIVDRQLEELRGGDFSHAYEYASSDIQRRYDVAQFAAMIQANYPGMTESSRAQYGEVRTKGPHATVEVYLIGPEGEVLPCVYIMVHEGDSWRIDGADVLPPWPPDMRMQGTML